METAVYLYGFAKRRPPLSSSGTSPLKFSEAGMTVLTLFAFRFGRMGRRGFGGLWGAGRGRDAETLLRTFIEFVHYAEIISHEQLLSW